MPKQIIIAEQHHIAAVFSEDQIQELVVATGHHQIGDVYLGTVENVLPGIDAAFVNIGDSERNGFIHVTDLGPLKLKRTAAAITELLTPQQKVLVQVMKEPTGNKGPRLTGNITLPGRYIVLMPFGRGVNLSRRIKSESERNRLRALAILLKPAGMGLLIRTEAEGKPEEAIIEDLETLQKQWETVQQEAQFTRPPALLNRDDDFIQRVLRDMYDAQVNRIVVDSNTGLKRVKQYLVNWSGGQVPPGVLIDHHRDRASILDYFRVNAAIREALKPRVDLPSGGYIIIEPTEALTVVDVNSGSFTRSATARETVLWTNCEAATEIARQLRLRNIAGVIIVDFIDMESRKDQLQVLEHFNKAIKADKARPQIAQLSELGLVELTRKRQGKNIYELFGQTCPTCGGLGHLFHMPGEPESRDREFAGTPRERVLPAVPEMTEQRSVTLPSKESRTLTPRLQEKGESYEAMGEVASDYSSDDSTLNLLNHPSYQAAQGIDNNRRHRHRRHRIGRDEGTPNESQIPSNQDALVNDDQEYAHADAEPELPPTPEVSSPRVAKNDWAERADISGGFLRSRSVSEGHSELSKTAERTKPTKPEPVRPIVEPPEIVSVEMTPQEQDVYALMGVSPLVRLNRTIKNPRSVIINVTLPGQLPAVDLTRTETPAETSIQTPDAQLNRSPMQTVLQTPDAQLDRSPMETVLQTPDAEEDITIQMVEPAPESLPDPPHTPPAVEMMHEEQDNSLGINRRRRRRSSTDS